MSETYTIVLEHLRVIRRDMARMSGAMQTMQAEMTAIRHQRAAVVTLQDHDYSDIAELKRPVDRIEQRLDLVG